MKQPAPKMFSRFRWLLGAGTLVACWLVSFSASAAPAPGEGPAGGPEQVNAEVLYRWAQEYRRRDEPRAALEFLRAAVAQAPERLQWAEELAALHEALGQPEQALAIYRALQAHPETAVRAARKVRYLEATLLARQGRVEEARHRFTALAQDYPQDTLILYSRGVAEMLTGRLQAAIATFREVIALDPDYANAYLNLATTYERAGRIRAAVNTLQALVERGRPPSAVRLAQIRLGLIEARLLIEEGNLQEAWAVLESLLAENGDHTALLAMAADVQRRLGDREHELRLRERLLRLQPDNPPVMLRLAELYLLTDRVRAAYDMLEALVAGHAGTPFARQAESLLERLLATPTGQMVAFQKEEERLEQLQAAVAADPADFEAQWGLAQILLQRREYAAARTPLEAVVRLRPDFREAWLQLAAVLDTLGRFGEAVTAYARAVALTEDPREAAALAEDLQLVNAKRLYVEERFDLAAREFEQIVARDAGNALAHFYLGLVYSNREEPAKAASQYQAVLQLVPGHVGARFNLANTFERMNREEDAIDEYRKILQSNPPPEVARTARQRLKATERRIRGWVASLGYSMSFDDNTNLGDTVSVQDYRSNLVLSLAYQRKLRNGVRLRFSTTPTYEVYHESQFDFLNTSTTLSATYIPRGITLVGGYTYRTSLGLVTANRFSNSSTFFTEAFTRRRLPHLLRLLGGERVATGISAALSYTDFVADDSPFFSAYTTALDLGLEQPLALGWGLKLGYHFVDNDNQELIGSDYAYRSHGVNAGLEWGPRAGLLVTLDLRYTRLNYKNPDSFTRFTERRRNTRYNAALGASYRLRNNVRLFANLSWTRNDSNLPVGFILNPQDIVEGQQSSSLSDYERLIFSTGINVFF